MSNYIKQIQLQGTTYQLYDSRVASCLTGSTPPTTSTVGQVGQFYIDTTTQIAYICISVTTSGNTTLYDWKPVTYESAEIQVG